MKNLFKKKRNWDINLLKINDYYIVEITDHNIRFSDLISIYSELIRFIFKDTLIIALSQFIDETQGMLDHKGEAKTELIRQYDLQVAFTKDYSSSTQPFIEDREYVLNITGKPNIEWLNDVLVFGGASLSNIIYGVQFVGTQWVDEIVKRNQTFTRWFWLEIEDDAIVRLRDEVDLLFWTSDSHLCILSTENYFHELLNFIEKLAEKYSMSANVQEKQ